MYKSTHPWTSLASWLDSVADCFRARATGVVLGLGTGVLLSAPAQAGTVLTGFQTTGADMTGAKITANFLGGGSQTITIRLVP